MPEIRPLLAKDNVDNRRGAGSVERIEAGGPVHVRPRSARAMPTRAPLPVARRWRIRATCRAPGAGRRSAQRPGRPARGLVGLLWVSPLPVSYTHLRAHETGRNLVC